MKNIRLRIFLALSIAFTLPPSPSFASWEWLPEFQSLTEEEQTRMFEGPTRFDSEYASSVLSFSKPYDWEYLWLAHPHAIDLTVGSINSSQFFLHERLKVHHSLNRHLELRITQFQERDMERDSSHFIGEMVFWPSEKFGLSAYGEASLYKRENDTGLALLFRPTPRHEIRLFNTWVDVTRLKRSDRTDTYIEPDMPYSRGLVGRLWSNPDGDEEGNFLEYAFRHETKTRWSFPDQGFEYQYWKVFGEVFARKRIGSDLRVAPRIQWDRKLETWYPGSSGSSVRQQAWKVDRLLADLRFEVERLGPGRDWRLIPGFQVQYRRWVTDPGVGIYRDFLPYSWLEIPAFGSGAARDVWVLGIDGTLHQSSGPREIFLPQETSGVFEGRLTTGYEFRFAERGILRLLVSWDYDEFGKKQIFEGGNGQMSFNF